MTARTRKLFESVMLPALIVTVCCALSVKAASGTWTGSEDALWINNANWDVESYPGMASGQTATFDSAGNGFTVIDLNSLPRIRNIAFVSGNAAPYTIGAGGSNVQDLLLEHMSLISMDSAVGAPQTIAAKMSLRTVSTGSTHYFLNDSLSHPLILAGDLQGGTDASTPGTKLVVVRGVGDVIIGGGISKGGGAAAQLLHEGSGTLTLAGANTLDLDTRVFSGTLKLAHPDALQGDGRAVIRAFDPGAFIELAYDGDSIAPFSFAMDNDYMGTFVSGVSSGNTGRNYNLNVVGLRRSVLNVTRSPAVTAGSPSISVQTLDLNAPATTTTFLNPTSADLIINNVTFYIGEYVKTVVLGGTSQGSRVDGVIDNGVFMTSVVKDNSGIWTLNGNNVYTGTTTVAGGTLKLSGSFGALTGTSLLTLSTGGTLVLDNTAQNLYDRLNNTTPVGLAGGTFAFSHAGGAVNYSEAAGSLVVQAGNGTVSNARADEGQTSTLTFSELVYEGGTVDFTGEGLGEDTRNRIIFTNPPALVGGVIGPWATVNGTALATYGPNGVTAYTPGATTDIAARGPASVIPDDAAAHVRIVDDGTDGPITLAEDDTAVASLTQANSDHAATVDTAGRTLRASYLAIEDGAAALTVGAAAGDGTLTALSAGGVLSLINNSENPLTVNADVADNGTASLLSALGDGTIVLRGGILHTGDIAVNSASLVLERSVDQVISNKISGAGALVKDGTNYMHLLGANTYTGPTYINAGIVRANADTTFGTPDGGVFIADGATLDIGCTPDVGGTRGQDEIFFGTQLFTVSGAGVDGNGVIVNNSSIRQINAFSRIELADDATFGGTSLWRMRNNSPTLVMNGHTLTKTGPNMIELHDCNVTPGDGHINVAAGILRPVYATEFNGSAANTITVQAGAQFALYRIANPQLWSIILENGGILFADSVENDTQNRWVGPVQLNGEAVFSGTGGADLQGLISGDWPVVKSDTGRFVFSGTNNTYTGQTRIEGGTLAAASLRNVGEASSLGQPADAADATIIVGSSGAGGTLEYIGTGDTTARVISMGGSTSFKHSGTGLLKLTSNLAVTGSGNRIVRFMGNAFEPGGEFAGNIANVGGTSVEVQKIESGRWLLSGSNSFGGSLLINGGELAVSGAIDHGVGNVYIGTSSGGSGILRVLPGALISGDYPTSSEYCRFIIGYNTGADGAVYMEGGSLIRDTRGSNHGFSLAYSKNYGHFNISGGVFNTRRLHMGGSAASTAGGRSVIRVKGGTMTFTEYMMVGRYPGDAAVINVEGGTLDHSAGSHPLAIGFDGGRGEVNVIGGTLDNTAQTITVRQNGGYATGVVSVCSGTLVTKEIIRSHANGAVWLNFAGGTLKAAASSTAFVPANMNGVYSFGAVGGFAGGAVIDTDGNDVTVAAAVQAPADNGVYAITVASKGEGYLGEPYVSIRGGGGVGAAAIANMEPDGNNRYRVASITVTSPGSGFTETPTVTLEMGGFSTAATLGAITMLPNVSGGLTKAGAGTLTLSAINTYQGATKVSGGTLKLAGAKALPTGTDVILDGGILDLNGYTVTNGVSGSGTLANGALQTVISPAGAGVIGSETLTLNGAALAGTYLADVAADGTSDHVTIDGSIDLDSMTLEIVDPLLLDRDQEYTIMAVTGLVTGKMTGANLPDSRWKVVGSGGVVKLRFVDGLVIKIK